MANNRVYYAIHSVSFKKSGGPPTNEVVQIVPGVDVEPTGSMGQPIWEVARGAQSVGMTTTFNFEQVFELGQLEIYEFIEAEPAAEVTVEKVLDGTKPLFFMTTERGTVSLPARTANYTTDVAISIYSDTQTRASGVPLSMVVGSGMYLSSINYTFPVDGNFTESITLVGNDKIWADFEGVTGSADAFPAEGTSNAGVPVGFPSGLQFQNLEDASVIGSGVQRRENFRTDALAATKLPRELPGVDINGKGGIERIQTITISTDLGREDIFELGRKRPYTKFVTFPIEVTCAIEVITSQGDFVDAIAFDENCTRSKNTENQEIIIELCEGLKIDLGQKNRLQSVDMSGGEAGGGNMTVTYNYSNFNDLTITHATFT